jgi:energy-converting hydrogenase Eha subunit H
MSVFYIILSVFFFIILWIISSMICLSFAEKVIEIKKRHKYFRRFIFWISISPLSPIVLIVMWLSAGIVIIYEFFSEFYKENI